MYVSLKRKQRLKGAMGPKRNWLFGMKDLNMLKY